MERMLLHQFAEKLELQGYSKRTIKDCPYEVGLFFTYLQAEHNISSIAEVTPEILQEYHAYVQYTKLVDGNYRAPGTIARKLLSIKLFYKVMFAEGLINQDYAEYIRPPKQKKNLPRHVPSEQDMKKLLESIQPVNPITTRDRAMLELMYATGLRNEEVRSCTIDNLDLQERTLFVTGKGSKDRVVPVGDWVMPYLQEYLAAARPKLLNPKQVTNLLFVSKNGRKITFGNLCDMIKKYARKAGLNQPISPHSFRHACATHLLKAGADIRYVQELLGHEDLSSTQIYTRIDISFLKQAHKRFHPREKEISREQ